MTTPIISLIIPVHNAEKYLQNTLNSVKNQTFADFEVLCINDGSSDNSLDILRKFAESDNRFIVFNQQNQGVSLARNYGIKNASGKYIMFLDNDDTLHPQAMEYAFKLIEKTKADICQFKYKRLFPNETISYSFYNKCPSFSVKNNPIELFLDKKLPKTVLVWDKIYKSELAKKVTFKNVQPGEDDLFSFETMALAKTMAFANITLLYYLQNPASKLHTTGAEKYHLNRLKITDEMYRIIHKNINVYTHNSKVQKQLLQYYANHFLFKEYISQPLRKKMNKGKIDEYVKTVMQKIQSGEVEESLFRFRYRLVLKLLAKKQYSLASLIMA